MNIQQLVARAAQSRASDLHFVCGLPPKARIRGALQTLDEAVLTAEDCRRFAGELVSKQDFQTLETVGEVDASADTDCGVRLRVNLFLRRGTISGALRLLPDGIPLLEELGLPPKVAELTELERGIVLVTGETGSGKSTTLAAMINCINHTRPEHILTLEDPIEYYYTPDRSIVNQRQVGRDTQSYAAGLRAALREDPDVLLIGEMRDLTTIETALTAAETGHLVFSTLHTGGAADSIDRIVGVFPAERQNQIRMQLSQTLKAVLAQQLLPTRDGTGRVCACELMVVTPAIRNLIREGKTPQIENAIATSAAEGGITMDNALLRLCKAGKLNGDVARRAARDPEYIKKNLLY